MSDAWVSCAYGDGDVDEKLLRLGHARRLLGLSTPLVSMNLFKGFSRKTNPVVTDRAVVWVDESHSSGEGKTNPDPREKKEDRRLREESENVRGKKRLMQVRKDRGMEKFFGTAPGRLIADLKNTPHTEDKELSRAIMRQRFAAWSVMYKDFRDPTPLQQMKWYDSLRWIKRIEDKNDDFFVSNFKYAMDNGYEQEYHDTTTRRRRYVNPLAFSRGITYDTQLPIMVVEFKRTKPAVGKFRRILYGIFVIASTTKADGNKPYRLELRRLISGASKGLTDSASAELAYTNELAQEVNRRCAKDIKNGTSPKAVPYATWPQWKRKKTIPTDESGDCAQSDHAIAQEMLDLIYADFADTPFGQDFKVAARRYITDVYPVAFEMSRFPDGSVPMLWGSLGLDATARARRQSLVKVPEDETMSLYELELRERGEAAAERRASKVNLKLDRSNYDGHIQQQRQKKILRKRKTLETKYLTTGNELHLLHQDYDEKQRLIKAVVQRRRQQKN
jgi:hypothetical protein